MVDGLSGTYAEGYVYTPSELPKTLECARFISLRLFDLVNQGVKVIDLVVF